MCRKWGRKEKERMRREKQQMQGSKEIEVGVTKGKTVPAQVSPPLVPLAQGLLDINSEKSV